jgi:hypothetical protein
MSYQSNTKDEYWRLAPTKKQRRMGYSTSSKDELRQYVLDRRLPFRFSERTASKERLVELLLRADLERTFTKFLDLPPELVTRICEFYVSDFDREEALWMPAQPPLARTSTFLRKTVLPIFYSQCKFAIQGTIRQLFTRVVARLTRASSDIICRVPPQYLRYLRKFRIFFHPHHETLKRSWDAHGPKGQMFVDVEIESESRLGCGFQACTARAMRNERDEAMGLIRERAPDCTDGLRDLMNEQGMRFSKSGGDLMLTAFS